MRAAAITDGAVDPTLGASLTSLGYDRDWEELARVGAGEPLDDGRTHRRRVTMGPGAR